MRCSVAIVALVACGKGSAPPPPATGSGSGSAPVAAGSAGAGSATAGNAAAGSAAAWTCEPLPFEPSTPLAEASGAAWLDGKLVAIGDSGTHGAYAIIDPDTGKTLEQGTLPLGKPATASDDLEGISAWGDRLYGLSSAGWVRVWARTAKGFELVQGPYPLGPVDLPNNSGIGDKPPKGDGMVCPIEGTNCGRNYEGLCLAPQTGGINPLACQGFALSKADGHLYCVMLDAALHQLVVHRDHAIEVGRPGIAADCAFGDDGTLWVGNNLFGTNSVLRIDRALDPAHATITSLGPLGPGFAETIAARGDTVFRMSDTGGAPSLMAKFRCAPNPR